MEAKSYLFNKEYRETKYLLSCNNKEMLFMRHPFYFAYLLNFLAIIDTTGQRIPATTQMTQLLPQSKVTKL